MGRGMGRGWSRLLGGPVGGRGWFPGRLTGGTLRGFSGGLVGGRGWFPGRLRGFSGGLVGGSWFVRGTRTLDGTLGGGMRERGR
jgi:hypothetical protein